MHFPASRRTTAVWMSLTVAFFFTARTAPLLAQASVPGSGARVTDVGDTFEDPNWAFAPQNPKSSHNIDHQQRQPRGASNNGIWFESLKRGHPDVVMRIETPEGGIPGSMGALFMQTKSSGIPGTATMKQQQDDFVMHFSSSIGGALPVSWSPSTTVRICLPPFEKWEQRTGATFGWRASVTGFGPLEDEEGETYSTKRGLFGLFDGKPQSRRGQKGVDNFYPGIFVQFNCKKDTGKEKDSAVLLIRGNDYGMDVRGPEITEPGWWTLGMSFTPDGRAHYYARKGVENLTAADHICSHFPQGVQCHRLNTMFFDLCNQDDGKSWSTPWVVDDVAFYNGRGPVMAGGPVHESRR